MKRRASIAAAAFAVVLCFIASIVAEGAEMSDAYVGLRNMALGMTPDMVGLSPALSGKCPYHGHNQFFVLELCRCHGGSGPRRPGRGFTLQMAVGLMGGEGS